MCRTAVVAGARDLDQALPVEEHVDRLATMTAGQHDSPWADAMKRSCESAGIVSIA